VYLEPLRGPFRIQQQVQSSFTYMSPAVHVPSALMASQLGYKRDSFDAKTKFHCKTNNTSNKPN